MKKSTILVFGGNFFPEPIGIGKYNGEMVMWLADQGFDCTVVTTFPYYPHWKIQAPYIQKSFWYKLEKITLENGAKIKVVRCPSYIPKIPKGKTRLISEFSFFVSAFFVFIILLFKQKFDYLITIAPPFELGLLGIFYKKIRGTKVLYHIQDLQIDAAKNLKMVKSKIIINTFFSIEKFILKNSDWVSTISKGMKEKIENKCNKTVLYLPNWVDLENFYPILNKDDIKKNYGFKMTDKIILYSGAIGHKQGLEFILRIAKRLENVREIKFAICGTGPYKERLMKLKMEMKLSNVFFLPLQPLHLFNCFLNMADLHLILQKKGISDLFLPSKLSTILSVGGVSIVAASKDTSLHNIIKSSNMGILIEPENEDQFIAAISSTNQTDLLQKSKNARLYAEEYLAKHKILDNFFSSIFSQRKLLTENTFSKTLKTEKNANITV